MRVWCLVLFLAAQGRLSSHQQSSSNFAASLLTGLFDTITATADSKGCPGKCVHAIASLICDDIIEDAPCPYASFRCCIEKKPPPIYHQEGQDPHEANTRQPDSGEDDDDEDDDEEEEEDDFYMPLPMPSTTKPPPTTLPTTSTTTTTSTAAPRPKPQGSTTRRAVQLVDASSRAPISEEDASFGDAASTEEPDASQEGSTEEDEELKDSASRQEVTCPGLCVATHIAKFCEEVVDGTDDLCPKNLHCCVSKEREGESAEDISHGSSSPALSSSSPLHVINRSNVTAVEDQPSKVEDGEGTTALPPVFIPEELRCQGTCVSTLFSFLCDDIDLEAVCPHRGRCCITRRVTTPPPPPPPLCPGVCVAAQRPDLCPQPSTILRHTSNCLQGTLCCANGFPMRHPHPHAPSHPNSPSHGHNGTGDIFIPPSHPHPSRPLPHRPPPFFHRPGPGYYPPPPRHPPPRPNFKPHPNPTPSTTEVSTKQEGGQNAPPRPEVDERPLCPGSCIFNYLSFTCFRNAEMTNLFRCRKSGTRCCAPKSVIRDLEEQNNLARNDSNHVHNDPASINGSSSGGGSGPSGPKGATPTASTSPRPSSSFNRYICGVKGNRRSGRVVGGEDAEPGEWCWQVALIDSLNQYLCGGALIGTQWVLTAAHCVTNTVRSGDAIYVRVGDHDLTSKYGSPGAQTLRVTTTYIHHNHNSQTLDNDIALLKLHGQVELKEGVCLVCLPARGVSQVAGKRCIVTGYGYMGETAGPIPLRVREAEVPTVSDSECIRKINAVTEKIFILPASSFCAGGEEGHDACQGDGGGPLVCQDDGYYELTGLVSWGFGCGRADVPGVYVKVSSFIGWINQIISVNNL